MTGDWLESVTDRAFVEVRGLADREYRNVLEGATLAVRALADSQQRFSEHSLDLREVERLMGAFSGELGKLDEVLEVLAAYARRMRDTSRSSSAGTLH
jgi:hypothetical protein